MASLFFSAVKITSQANNGLSYGKNWQQLVCDTLCAIVGIHSMPLQLEDVIIWFVFYTQKYLSSEKWFYMERDTQNVLYMSGREKVQGKNQLLVKHGQKSWQKARENQAKQDERLSEFA